jgi:hypothetical protein
MFRVHLLSKITKPSGFGYPFNNDHKEKHKLKRPYLSLFSLLLLR